MVGKGMPWRSRLCSMRVVHVDQACNAVNRYRTGSGLPRMLEGLLQCHLVPRTKCLGVGMG